MSMKTATCEIQLIRLKEKQVTVSQCSATGCKRKPPDANNNAAC